MPRSTRNSCAILMTSLLSLGASALGCARQEGAVELDWSIVDGNFEDLFPGQAYSNSCALKRLALLELPSSDPAMSTTIQVDLKLEIRLRVFDCPDSMSIQECEQQPLIGDAIFNCDNMRGTIGGLGSADRSYLFVVDTQLTPSVGNAIFARQSCVATPGARRRRIRAGQITNLAVYQVVLQATEERPLLVHECEQPATPSSSSTTQTPSSS